MKTLQQLLDAKPLRIVSVTPQTMVFEALEAMARYDIGALLVMDGPRLVGIMSERDYARKVILLSKSSREIPVSAIMVDKVVFVTLEQSVEHCLALMTHRHIRHLPVVQDGTVVGLLSIGDLVKEVISDQAFVIRKMSEYIMS